MIYTSNVIDLEYTTTGVQEVIEITPNIGGVVQVQCSEDASYDLYASIHANFPLIKEGTFTGAKILGKFEFASKLQFDILSLGSSGNIRAQIVLRYNY